MSVLVQTVTYEVEAGDLSIFRNAVHKHAEITRQRESGCSRFDVSYGADRPTLCLTYVVFEGPDAFDHHVASDHYHLFRELSSSWVISRIEQFWELGASPRRFGSPAAT